MYEICRKDVDVAESLSRLDATVRARIAGLSAGAAGTGITADGQSVEEQLKNLVGCLISVGIHSTNTYTLRTLT